MQMVNIRNHKISKCAFCRKWYDPKNVALHPRSAASGFWEYDPMMQAQCQIKNITTKGAQGCSQFVSKI